MENIKNLLFDLGGVIMDIERQRAVDSFKSIGFKDADTYLGEYAQTGSFAALESGLITPEQWRADIRSHISNAVSDADIDNAFINFLVGIPVHRLQTLGQLRSKYKIYMLSNTNPVMWNTEIARQFRCEGKEREDYFDGIVTSFEAGCMKPDAAIFNFASQKLGIKPSETLFLDDSQKNCEAARALGWHAACVEPGKEFSDVIKSLGL